MHLAVVRAVEQAQERRDTRGGAWRIPGPFDGRDLEVLDIDRDGTADLAGASGSGYVEVFHNQSPDPDRLSLLHSHWRRE